MGLNDYIEFQIGVADSISFSVEQLVTVANMLFLCCIILLCAPLLTLPLGDRQNVEHMFWYGCSESWELNQDPHTVDDDEEVSISSTTGKLDYVTHAAISRPHCGVESRPSCDDDNSRHKRYAVYNSTWKSYEVTFRVLRYPDKKGLTRMGVDEVVEQAFETWASETNLTFRQVSESADINIEFIDANESHIQYFRNRTIFGYAYMPLQGGVYFNEDWGWSIRNSSGGKDLFRALMHELGHSLGLAHSNVSGSIMQPVISLRYNPDFKLHSDDVEGIQNLYGNRTVQLPDLCSSSSFDAMFEYPDGIIYIFKGEYYWKVIRDGIASGYPRLISRKWRGLPSNIDAATATDMDLTYFFKGNKYWTYNHTSAHIYNVSYISVGWPGIPDNVDGAMWVGDSTYYFFKGDVYWQYNASQFPEVSIVYPKPVSVLGNIRGHLDDVLLSVNSGYMYFFTSGSYYRCSFRIAPVDQEWLYQLNGPYLTGPIWFRCGKTVKKTAHTAGTATTATVVATIATSNSTVLALSTPNICSTCTSSTDTVAVVTSGNQDGQRIEC